MAQVIGNVTFLVGTVIAVDAAGNERQLQLGDAVFVGEKILTVGNSQVMIGLENGESLALGRSSEAILDQDLLDLTSYGLEDELAEAELLQRQLLENPDFDLSQLEATAAGGQTGGTLKSVPVILSHEFDINYSGLNGDDQAGNGLNAGPDQIQGRDLGDELDLVANPEISFPNQFTVDEDTTYSGVFDAVDPDGGDVEFELVSGPTNGTITLNPNGEFVYTPSPDFNGSDQIEIVVTDSQGSQTNQTISIIVTPVDDAPKAEESNDLGSVNENTNTNIDLKDLFEEVDGEEISVGLKDGETLPEGLEINEQGELVGTPTIPGDYEFIVIGTDESGNQTETRVELGVEEAFNDAPTFVGNADLGNVDEDESLSLDLSDDFTDEEGDQLSFELADGNQLPEGLTLTDEGTLTGAPSVPGEYQFTINVTDTAGNTTQQTYQLTVDNTLPPEAPTGDISDDGSKIIGEAEPGSTIIVELPDGSSRETVVDDDGRYELELTPPLTNGEDVSIIAEDEAGQSKKVNLSAPDTTAPDVNENDIRITDEGDGVTGRTEPNAVISITVPGVALPIVVEADENGDFFADLNPPLIDGETVVVDVSDQAGNSTEVELTAPDTTAPDAPTAAINGDGTQLTGSTEPNTELTITLPDGSTETVTSDDDGNYSYDLSPALVDGETVSVIATDAGGDSTSTDAQAPDLAAPNAPTAVINGDGTQLTGSTEPDTELTITLPDGSTETVTSDDDGNYSYDLSPALVDGETVSVIATDAGGDSESTYVEAPDIVTDATVSLNDTAETNDNTPTFSGTSSNVDGDITVSIGGESHTVTPEADGSWSIEWPAALGEGGHTVTVDAVDADGNAITQISDNFTVDINDAPVTSAIAVSTDEDVVASVILTATDIDSSISSFSISELPTNGVLYLDAAMTQAVAVDTDYAATTDQLTLYFKPTEDWAGVDSLSFSAKDTGGLESNSSEVTITVEAVADKPILELLEPSTSSFDNSALVGQWKFDEGSGNTTYNQVTDEEGTLSRGADFVSGNRGTAVDLDGKNDYVRLDQDQSEVLGGTASLSFWIKTTQKGENIGYEAPAVIGNESNGDENDIQWGWIDQNGKIAISVGNDKGATSTTTINDDQWHHVVFTRDSITGETSIYVNGVFEGSVLLNDQTGTKADGLSLQDFGRLVEQNVGFFGSPDHKYLSAQLDDIRIYNEVISSDVVESIYANESLLGDGYTQLASINASLTDVDGSESLTVEIHDLAIGDIITDGVNTFTATDGNTSVDVTSWNTSSLYFKGDTSTVMTVEAIATETSTGDSSSTTISYPVYTEGELAVDGDTITGSDGWDVISGDVGGSIVNGSDGAEVIYVVDTSGSMAWSAEDGTEFEPGDVDGNGDPIKSRMDIVRESLIQLNNEYAAAVNAGVNVTITIITYSGSAASTPITWDLNDQTLADINAHINGSALEPDGGTPQDKAVEALWSELDALESDVDKDVGNAKVYFITDGTPSDTGDAVDANNEFLSNLEGLSSQPEIHGIAIGNGIDQSDVDAYLNPIDNTVNPDGSYGAAVVPDVTQLPEVIIGLNPPQETDVISGAGNDIIFGDVINTDALSGVEGKGYQGLIDYLEAQNGTTPTEDEVMAYIRENHDSLNVGGDLVGAADTIDAGTGSDYLYGQGGDDILSGGEHEDFIFGGTGSDTMSGGSHSDTFVWKSGDNQDVNQAIANDVITDFQQGIGGDVLDLSDLLIDEESNDLTQYLSFEVENGNTIVNVSADGQNLTQKITLEGVDLTVYGDDSEIITQLLNQGNLDIDQ